MALSYATLCKFVKFFPSSLEMTIESVALISIPHQKDVFFSRRRNHHGEE